MTDDRTEANRSSTWATWLVRRSSAAGCRHLPGNSALPHHSHVVIVERSRRPLAAIGHDGRAISLGDVSEPTSERIRQRLLPEDRADTRASHYKVEFTIRADAVIRAGVDPALLDHTGGWSGDDLWFWSLEKLIVYVRAADEHTGTTPAEICQRIARRRGIDLGQAPS